MENYPPEVRAEIRTVVEWLDANAGCPWDDAPAEIRAHYDRWKGIIRGVPDLTDNLGTMWTCPGLSSFGRLWLAEQATTSPDGEEKGEDDKSFRPAKEVCDLFGFGSHLELKQFLGDHPEVRTRRPKTKSGTDNPQRLDVHIGDVAASRKAREIDPLDLPVEKVDKALSELARRKAEIDARRKVT